MKWIYTEMMEDEMQETRSVLGAICSSYDTFFEAEKKIADYMMENKAAVVDMTCLLYTSPSPRD